MNYLQQEQVFILAKSLWLEHRASILHTWRMRAVQDARNAVEALEVPHEVSLTPA